MASQEKICNYLDIPIQHVNNQVLSSMGRGHDRKKLEMLLQKFRSQVPDVALRTTVLTGFPGETEEAFTELMDFITAYRFERLGVFPYSHEEDTPAYGVLRDQVAGPVKAERASRIMERQQAISLELNEAKIGKTFKVLMDRREGDYFIGRTQYDSPEVDNEVLVEASHELSTGQFYMIKITGAGEFDLYGTVVKA